MRSLELAETNYKQVDAASYDLAAVEFDRLTERFYGPLAMRMLDQPCSSSWRFRLCPLLMLSFCKFYRKYSGAAVATNVIV
jgi:hypothetical protein